MKTLCKENIGNITKIYLIEDFSHIMCESIRTHKRIRSYESIGISRLDALKLIKGHY